MAYVVAPHLQDADDQSRALIGWEQEHEQLGSGWFRGSAWQLVMHEGCIHREIVNRHHRQQVRPPADHVVLSMALAVDPGSRLDGRPLSHQSLVVFDAGSTHELVSSGGIDLVGLTVAAPFMERVLAPEMLEWLRRGPVHTNTQLPASDATALRRMFQSICRTVEQHGAGAATPLQERELLSASLTKLVHLMMSSMPGAWASSVPGHSEARHKLIKRAVEFMRAKVREDVSVADICEASFVSRRNLHYCFWEFLQTTPQAYMRALRLNAARRTLKSQDRKTLTEIACDFGFSNASHFTRLYKEMFGELPSDTRYAMRSNGMLQ